MDGQPGPAPSNFRVNDACPQSPDEWTKGAVTHPGSWWADHVAWLAQRSGSLVKAPAELGSPAHERIGKAPGAYVMEP